MLDTRSPVDGQSTPCGRLAERGYALLIVLLFIGTVGTMLLYYQLGNARNDRYQIYFAIGQEYAMIARAAHLYVQDHAYYSPYVDDLGDSNQLNRVSYYKSVLNSKIATYLEPLGQQTHAGENVITLENIRNLSVGGLIDSGMTFARPVRGVQYTFRAHGGMVPLGAAAQVQAASSLLVMYGRPAGGAVDIRTTADMAAFRAGAASNGLNRVGIVLPPSQQNNLKCRGDNAIVSWGNNDTDCLTSGEASAIGMDLDTFDVVAPAWESVEKQLSRNHVYRRPHPGLYGMNVMQQEIDMRGKFGNKGIKDATEIYTDTVNSERDGTALQIGTAAEGGAPVPLDDAILTVSYGRNTRKDDAGNVDINSADSVCQGLEATTCFLSDKPLVVNGNMAVSYKEDPKFPQAAPPDGTIPDRNMMTVGGVVKVLQGGVTVSANETKAPNKGVFDVTGGTGTSTFNINKQDASGNGGTVINKKVTVGTFNVADTGNSENFIVDDALIINGGNIQIGSTATPSQVIFTNAPLQSATGAKIDIDTTGKGTASGVYSSDADIKDFAQSGTNAMEFKNLHFAASPNGAKPTVSISGNVIIDPRGKHADFDCVGNACPDQVYNPPIKDPL